MKLTLTIEAEEHEADGLRPYQDGPAWKMVAWELSEWLRGQVKHAGRHELQEVRDMLIALMADERLSFD